MPGGQADPRQDAEHRGGVGLEDLLPVARVVGVLARFGELLAGVRAARAAMRSVEIAHQRRREMLDRHRGQPAPWSDERNPPGIAHASDRSAPGGGGRTRTFSAARVQRAARRARTSARRTTFGAARELVDLDVLLVGRGALRRHQARLVAQDQAAPRPR